MALGGENMLKIGEFSKLSMLTVKALRFYEKEGLLSPVRVDEWTGYRYYETDQLAAAARIKALRQLGFSVDEVRACLSSPDRSALLSAKAQELEQAHRRLAAQLSLLYYLMEETGMETKYQAVIKELPPCVVYSEERKLDSYGQVSELVRSSAEECRQLNPDMEFVKPDYGFCEYLDGEHRDKDILVRYSQAVAKAGDGNERIQFRALPAVKAVCIYHRGPYDRLGDAYAYLAEYVSKNGYTPLGQPRECYIDGAWNKPDPADWLTEIQFPILDTRDAAPFCQSCSMPLSDASLRGSEADGSVNPHYCKYCYDKGRFTGDMTMEEMIDFCAPAMAQSTPGMTQEAAKEQMRQYFPQLLRWKNKD